MHNYPMSAFTFCKASWAARGRESVTRSGAVPSALDLILGRSGAYLRCLTTKCAPATIDMDRRPPASTKFPFAVRVKGRARSAGAFDLTLSRNCCRLWIGRRTTACKSQGSLGRLTLVPVVSGGSRCGAVVQRTPFQRAAAAHRAWLRQRVPSFVPDYRRTRREGEPPH